MPTTSETCVFTIPHQPPPGVVPGPAMRCIEGEIARWNREPHAGSVTRVVVRCLLRIVRQAVDAGTAHGACGDEDGGRWTIEIRHLRHGMFITVYRPDGHCSFRFGWDSRVVFPPGPAALLAALAARNAAIEGDHAAVDAFSREWLGIARPQQWRAAVEAALLGDWVDTLGAGGTDVSVVLCLLDRQAHTEHQRLQPLWERRTGKARVRLLETPLTVGLIWGDLLADPHTPEDLVLRGEIADARLRPVLDELGPEEAETALSWALQPGATWAEAALGVGLSASYGERVRRKLKRLGARCGNERRTR